MATAPDRSAAPSHAPESLRHWVLEVAARTQPDRIHWCDGSEAEYLELVRQMIASGDLPVEAVRRTGGAAERHEGEVHPVEHQLHAHEDGDDVAAQEDAEGAEAEEGQAQQDRVVDEAGVLHA